MTPATMLQWQQTAATSAEAAAAANKAATRWGTRATYAADRAAALAAVAACDAAATLAAAEAANAAHVVDVITPHVIGPGRPRYSTRALESAETYAELAAEAAQRSGRMAADTD